MSKLMRVTNPLGGCLLFVNSSGFRKSDKQLLRHGGSFTDLRHQATVPSPNGISPILHLET
jgi:hypothetical protein